MTAEQALISIYQRSAARLRLQLQAALENSALGTARYQERQLLQVQGELKRLGVQTAQIVPSLAAGPYYAGAHAVDLVGEVARQGATFTGTHRQAIENLAANLAGRLDQATTLVGRRTQDTLRRIGLEHVAQGIAGGMTRKQVSDAIGHQIVREGVADALTGLVDTGRKRWQLDHYAQMAARTTTREAMTAGTVNRMTETGQLIVTISSHANPCPICEPFDGQTYSLPGHQVDGYDEATDLPPFHPACIHVATPGEDNLDAFEAAINGEPTSDDPAFRVPAAEREHLGLVDPLEPASPPLSPRARPSIGPGTKGRLADQRAAYALHHDPGPEPGAEDAWLAAVTKQDRDHNKALNSALGPDLAKFIDRKWGKDAGIRRQLLEGDMTVEEAGDLAYEEYNRIEGRRVEREDDRSLGFETRPFPCFSCGRFKRRPADICPHCGDDPVTGMDYVAGSMTIRDAKATREFNRAYGYGE